MTLEKETASLRKSFHESKDRKQAVSRWMKLIHALEGEPGVTRAKELLEHG